MNRTDIAAIAARLGRKFEASDVTEPLYLAASEYLASYQGDFNYLVDLKRRGRLSAGQAKGVLNCIVADARRAAPKAATAAAPAVNVANIPCGRYRVVDGLDGRSSTAVRLVKATWASDLPEGTRAVGILSAEGWLNLGFVSPAGTVSLWRKAAAFAPRVLASLAILAAADDTLVYGLAYAVEGSECYICGLELDTEESISAGYGPTCARNRGLPWGAKVVPAKVLLAREQAKAAAPTAEVPSRKSEVPTWPPTTAHVFPFDGFYLLSRDDGREIVQGASRFTTQADAEHALALRLGDGLEGPAYDSPAADYPRRARTYEEIFADDDEEEPAPLPKTPTYARSRWSRPDDWELASAAY